MSISQATKQAGRSNGKARTVVALHPASLSHLHPATAPAPPAHSIERPELVRRLMQAPKHAVIALLAPAGYGKSVLLSLWAECDPRTFAWLQLSPAESNPTLLRRRLAQTLAPLSESAEPAVLVLDRLASPEALAIVAELAHDPPPALTLALASRGDPPLALGRLRADERLLALGAAELAMSLQETERLMQIVGVTLDRQALQRLAARTEGWPAGVHLAALSLRTRTASDSEIDITGADHTIAEYVSEEVLAAIDTDTRAVLSRASILDELSGAMCDAVLARQGTGRLFAELAATGTMLVALDPAHTRFRCHRLVRDVLRRELELCKPAEIPLLHRRASDWLAAHGESERALEHALAARDTQLAGKLAWARAAEILYGHDDRVKQWLSGLTAQEIASSPPLALIAAHSDVAFGNLPSARHWSRLAEEALGHPHSDDPGTSSLLAGAQLVHAISAPNGIERMADEMELIQRQLDPGNALRPLAIMLGGVAARLLGERERASALHGQVLDDCSHEAMPLLAALSLTQLALIALEAGQLEQAEDRAAEAELLACDLGARRFTALTHATLAIVKSRRGLAEDAKRELGCASRLLALPGELMPWLEVETRVLMARTSVRLADAAHARALLSAASRLARRHEPVPRLLSWIDETWAEIDELGAASMSGPGSLTMAELRVLRFLPTHLSFREIGQRLHVSGNTVKSQAHAIYAKLDAASRTEAVARASALGLIDAAVV
ncbi:MAG: LuxR C-terminal-related transcriptional regulator [Solirubrobacteraceae bacterium]